MNTTIIIPSLNPDEKLEKVVKGMLAAGFKDIIIVNDGSDEAHREPFNRLAGYSECTILNHDVNKGKGRALKTAFEYVLENRKDISGVVTVDGDNQHFPKDVYACAKALEENKDSVILGVRNFDGKNVPPKSRFGNKMTSFVFRFVCGLNISDTQTGLRAIPFSYLKKMCDIEGERFEYETNMLLELKKSNIAYIQVPIETVYINENETTHFHPIRDSFKIYRIIFKYVFGSAASALIDLGVFTIAEFILSYCKIETGTMINIATVIARVISSLFNYSYNRKAVFDNHDGVAGTITRYYILCVCQMLVSMLLVRSVTALLGAAGIFIVIIKAVTDTCLFVLSYKIQQAWVFKEK